MSSRHVQALLIAGALALAACGGDGDAGNTAPAAKPEAGASAGPLPAITVQDVTADRPVALNSFIPSDRPTLLWFWAPH